MHHRGDSASSRFSCTALLARPMPGARLSIADTRLVLVWIAAQNCVESVALLSFGRKCEIKTRAARSVAPGPQATAVRFHDRAADGQPHAGPMRLRGTER